MSVGTEGSGKASGSEFWSDDVGVELESEEEDDVSEEEGDEGSGPSTHVSIRTLSQSRIEGDENVGMSSTEVLCSAFTVLVRGGVRYEDVGNVVPGNGDACCVRTPLRAAGEEGSEGSRCAFSNEATSPGVAR